MKINQNSVIEAREAFSKTGLISKSCAEPASYYNLISEQDIDVYDILELINDKIIQYVCLNKYQVTIKISDLRMKAYERKYIFWNGRLIDYYIMDLVRGRLIGRGYKVNFIGSDGSNQDSCLECDIESIHIDWSEAGLE